MNAIGAAAMLLALAAAAPAQQGTVPKPKPEDYPAHAQVGLLTLAAEYMVHSFSGQGESYVAPEYLTVDVAVYGEKGQKLEIDPGRFTLRIDGKKRAALPQAPGVVAASLSHPDWQAHRGLEGSAGMGNAGVILGRPQSTGRFPGDPQPGGERLPQPPRAPDAEDPSGQEKRPHVPPGELAVAVALPQGRVKGPVSGYLYFAYKGKVGKIKSLELLYEGAVLKLL